MAARCFFVAALALASGGCSANIGDSCFTNVDCSPFGDRFCDVSAPGGYCTLQGCDVILVNGVPTDTCPVEGSCVRFFEPIASELCDPMSSPSGCLPDERCLCDRTDPNDGLTCLGTNPGPNAPITAHCAPESTERRTCMLRCTRDRDCRQPDYECRQTGTDGAEPIPMVTNIHTTDGGMRFGVPSGVSLSFCVQRAPGATPPPLPGDFSIAPPDASRSPLTDGSAGG